MLHLLHSLLFSHFFLLRWDLGTILLGFPDSMFGIEMYGYISDNSSSVYTLRRVTNLLDGGHQFLRFCDKLLCGGHSFTEERRDNNMRTESANDISKRHPTSLLTWPSRQTRSGLAAAARLAKLSLQATRGATFTGICIPACRFSMCSSASSVVLIVFQAQETGL